MNKKFKFIILTFIVITLIVLISKLFAPQNTKYEFNINGEKVIVKEKNSNNYYFEIITPKSIYPFRIYSNLDKKKQIVSDIYLYKDKYIECVLPVINNKVYTDIVCYDDSILYNYNNLKGKYSNLDDYVNNIDIYNINSFNDDFSNTDKVGTIVYNLSDFNKKFAITTYKGLINNGKTINIFEKDVYNNKISTFVENYYIIADYDSNYSFYNFYVVDLLTDQIFKIKSNEEISFDSYIQGIVDNKIYLYDKDNENQFEIDIESKNINIVSNREYIRYYSNKGWERISKVKANKELLFSYDSLDNNFTSYNIVKETDDNYYLFKKYDNYYKLYRVDKNNINIYKFILNVKVTDINFNDDYLYYVYNNRLYYYSDSTGLITILEDSELEFNNTIKYYIY